MTWATSKNFKPLSVSVSAARTTNLLPTNVTKSVKKKSKSVFSKVMECTRRFGFRRWPNGTPASELDGNRVSERERSESFDGGNSGGEDGWDGVENGSHRSGGENRHLVAVSRRWSGLSFLGSLLFREISGCKLPTIRVYVTTFVGPGCRVTTWGASIGYIVIRDPCKF